MKFSHSVLLDSCAGGKYESYRVRRTLKKFVFATEKQSWPPRNDTWSLSISKDSINGHRLFLEHWHETERVIDEFETCDKCKKIHRTGKVKVQKNYHDQSKRIIIQKEDAILLKQFLEEWFDESFPEVDVESEQFKKDAYGAFKEGQ